MQWGKVGRLALLGMLLALLYLYASATVNLVSAWREQSHLATTVGALQGRYARLNSEHAKLLTPLWIETQARRLGMGYPNERQYLLRGSEGR